MELLRLTIMPNNAQKVVPNNSQSDRLYCEFPNYLAPFFPRYLAQSLSERSDLRWTHCGPSNSSSSSEFSLFGRRFVNPHLRPDLIPGASPHRD